MTRSLFPTLLLALIPSLAQAADGFALADKAGEHMDVLLDGKIVARYMYAYDKQRLNETYKPYLHVFDADGKAPITQGAGGKQYPHHRGIYIGWNQISVGGKKYDRWHMKGGEIAHQKFTEQSATADGATFTSQTHWNDDKGAPFLVEERTMTFKRAPAGGRITIDFASTLKAVQGDTLLGGDPEHAGIHYRPAGDILSDKTAYLYPKAGAKPHDDKDYAWVAEQYTLPGEKTYAVVEMNHPTNPLSTRVSAYRNYGRFGFFPKVEIKNGESRSFKYRFVIVDGTMPAADYIQKVWDAYAGVTTPSAVPETTLLAAEGAKKAAVPAPAK
ncbi:MAG TPA: DUF6807 family protein [Tepidisphaeraceae bacterium]|nr:DUF6807 family protein [Tepidisphaeraceae bacterium]